LIPLPEAARKKIQAWLPHVLAGYDYPLIETDNIVPNLAAPAITYHFSSVGTPSLYSSQPLRVVRRGDGSLDDVWGQYHYATAAVVLRAHTDAELGRMWEAFVRRCMSTRRNLLIYPDGVRFLEILDSKHLDPERLDSGKNLYWAQIDLRFEYEVSDISEEELIKTVHSTLEVGESDVALTWDSEVREVELAVGIVAYIAPPTSS
jgi:hypothetical protein